MNGVVNFNLTKEEVEAFMDLDILLMYGKHFAEEPGMKFRIVGNCLICDRPVYVTGKGLIKTNFGDRPMKKEKLRIFAISCVAMMMGQISEAMEHPEMLMQTDPFKIIKEHTE